jgi:hypothetical protein
LLPVFTNFIASVKSRRAISRNKALMNLMPGDKKVVENLQGVFARGREAITDAGVAKSELVNQTSKSMAKNLSKVGGTIAGSLGGGSAYAKTVGSPNIAKSIFTKMQSTYQSPLGVSKFLSKIGPRIPKLKLALTTGAVLLGAAAATKRMAKGFEMEEENPQRNVSATSGPGYLTWSKNQGLPANHLSTDNLPQALSDMRHTSVI